MRARRGALRDSSLALEYPGLSLPCRLRESPRRRTLALRVAEDGVLVVNAPAGVRHADIHGFVARHLDWIRARQAAAVSAPDWAEGMPLPFLGETLRLRCVPAEASRQRARVWREADALCFQPGAGEVEACVAARLAEDAVRAWYAQQARALFAERLALAAARAGRAVPAWRLSNARGRWGSLSPKGVVGLNWRLMKVDVAEIDYVICHELAHFRQRNHSPAFWREVAALYPDFAAARARLRAAGRQCFLF